MKDNTLKDQFNYLVGGYFGIREMDEYELKVYILKEVEEYIRELVLKNPISNFDYRGEAIKIEENTRFDFSEIKNRRLKVSGFFICLKKSFLWFLMLI